MAYDARILDVMIASPGDVAAERQVVRDVLNEWNVMHARTRKAFLVPVGWETHSAPELGGRPQQMINDRLLVHCDLLVGVFWTRLGSPTGVAASGTVEEIEKHVAAGKPAMLYFSDAPVAPASLNPDQYAQLTEFKTWAMTQGLVATFEGADQFRDMLRRDIELNLRDNAYLAEQMAPVVPPGFQRVSVSKEAARLLRLAADSQSTLVSHDRYLSGERVTAGGETIVGEQATPRELARWVDAIETLERHGLIAPINAKRNIFKVTHEGFEAAEQIASLDLEEDAEPVS